MTPAEMKTAPDVSPEELRPALKDSPQRWWLMVLLVLAMIFCYAQRGALSVAAPFMLKDGVFSLKEMGLLLSAFSWMYCFMQIPSGWLVDRFGVRLAYALGYAFWSVTTILTGMTKSLAMLAGLRVSLGMGQAVAFPASARAVANGFQDRERGTVVGLYLAGVRLGAALISWIGALFLVHYSWRLFFVTIGVAPLIWLAPWMWFQGKWEKRNGGAASHELPGQGQSFIASLALLRHRSILGIFLGFFAYDYAWFVYFNWSNTYLMGERKFSATEMGSFTALSYLVMMVFILLSGIASDWLVRRGYAEMKTRKTFIAAGLLIGCAIVPAGLVENRLTAVWLLMLSISGIGIASPNAWTLTQAVCAKKLVGTASGVQNFGGNLGGIIAPWLTGYIVDKTGSFARAFGLTGIILIAGIIAYLSLVKDKVED
ncbi:MAG: MFS transporter [Blastocatellia bacterium]|nr:MFS transporter [Blastocatellia bacterium]